MNYFTIKTWSWNLNCFIYNKIIFNFLMRENMEKLLNVYIYNW